ncbi:uncharacterized protein LOC114726198 [Neltuma alba]|uniref:uncharacterized protein LOC114726198 n=1 Tax=Neltuma alba TaxID=207710 RepID=UPI0010A477B8|nr:uncharacterized protein LOC114726198 [Prosopis alba]
MKRQRVVSVTGFEAAEMAATAKKKKPSKAHPGTDQKALLKNAEEEEDEKKKQVVGTEENVSGLANWDENWPCWIADFVDEQMSWGSVWFPFWDTDFSGEAFGALYGDVDWDDDIWDLKKEIPNPFEG